MTGVVNIRRGNESLIRLWGGTVAPFFAHVNMRIIYGLGASVEENRWI